MPVLYYYRKGKLVRSGKLRFSLTPKSTLKNILLWSVNDTLLPEIVSSATNGRDTWYLITRLRHGAKDQLRRRDT